MSKNPGFNAVPVPLSVVVLLVNEMYKNWRVLIFVGLCDLFASTPRFSSG